MYRGTPVIYIDYTDYDEIAHHSGPERGETLDALDGVDRQVESLVKAGEDAPRPYKFILLSDHGQSLGSTFLQRYGKSLTDVISDLMGGVIGRATATGQRRAVGHAQRRPERGRPGGRARPAAITRVAFKGQTEDGAIDVVPSEERAGETAGGGATGAGRVRLRQPRAHLLPAPRRAGSRWSRSRRAGRAWSRR